MKASRIVIVGTGAEARTAADAFSASGIIVLGFLESDPENKITDLNDINVFAHYEDEEARTVLRDENIQFFVAIGDIRERKKIYEKVAEYTKRPSANAVNPFSWQSPYSKLGFGNFLGAGVIVNANAGIGDLNHIHSGVTVEPDAMIGNYCTLSAGVRVGANVRIEDNTFIGTGAVIFPGVTIGDGCMIGAGSVVLRSVDAKKTVFGNPAAVV